MSTVSTTRWAVAKPKPGHGDTPDEDGFIHHRDPNTCLACRLGPGYPKVHTHNVWRPLKDQR